MGSHQQDLLELEEREDAIGVGPLQDFTVAGYPDEVLAFHISLLNEAAEQEPENRASYEQALVTARWWLKAQELQRRRLA